MIMTNAVYFKGKWLQPFPKNFTETKGFYVNPTESVQVPFMTTSGTYYFGYSKKLDAKVLRIPYKVKKMQLCNAKLINLDLGW